MLANCFRFAPRDSVPGLIAKICKYLKDHPGWSEAELEEQIRQLVGQTGVASFNGRTGDIILTDKDINNLKISSAYFAEGNETIEDLNLVELYKQGIRFVFTNWNSVTSGYDKSFVLDYFSGSGNVVYYPIASASGGSSDSPVVSVNSMVGAVTISVVDVSESDSQNQFAKIFINEGEDYPIEPSYDSDRLGGKPPSYYADAKVVDDKLTELNKANAQQDEVIAGKANDADLATVAKSGSYTDLTNKPTIPTVPSALPNPNALTFTGSVNETYDGSAAKSVSIPTIPESLKNPNKLVLSGAVTAEYDGSSEVSVEIPAGGGYTLPIASPTTLGGVKPAAKTDEMTQAVGVDAEGGLWALPGGGGGESEFAGTETLLASGTIPSGTAAMSITDSGVTYDEFLKHRYVKVTFKSTEDNYPEYSFNGNPSATWHLNGIGNNTSSGHFTIFEPVGKLLRPAMAFSAPYSTLGNDGFEIGHYNIDPRSALISYDRWHSYQGSNTMKFAFASKATTADWNWWIYVLD